MGWCTKVIVFGKEAPRTCFGGFCSIPAHVDDIAIVIRIGVLSFFEGIVIPFEIHGANLELSNFVVGTGVPNGVVAVYHDLLIIIFNELSSKVPITPCFTQFCFNKRVSDSFGRPLFDSSRPTVGPNICHLSIFSLKVSIAKRNRSTNTVNTHRIDIRIPIICMLATCRDVYNSNIAFEECSLKIGITVSRFILPFKKLIVF